MSVQLRSDSIGALGVMFRYQDADNYYRFSMRPGFSDGYLRLVKTVAGVVTVLWDAAGGIRYSQLFDDVLTVDCVGDHLTGYRNGLQLFSVADRDLTSGRVGLYCWQNPGARFIEVRVGRPVWSPYYTFRQEERRPAGTRVQIFGGNVMNAERDGIHADPVEPGLVHRFIAPYDEQGVMRFPVDAVNLRVVNSDQSSGHTRTFVPNNGYSLQDGIRVLRNADGTGLILAKEGGATFDIGSYHLTFIYRRDNRDVDPNSQAYSQAGSTTSESVTLTMQL